MDTIAAQTTRFLGVVAVDRDPVGGPRSGRLRRIGRTIMERKLDAAPQGVVRREKHASARIIVIRIIRDLARPLASLDRHIAALAPLAVGNSEIARIVVSLQRDRDRILRAIQCLGQTVPPPESSR